MNELNLDLGQMPCPARVLDGFEAPLNVDATSPAPGVVRLAITATAPVNVNSADCKTNGCGGEAAWSKGPYAGLCTACAAIAKTRFRQSVRAAVEHAVAELDRARAAELKAADTYRDARKRVAAAEAKVNVFRAILDRAIDGDEPDA